MKAKYLFISLLATLTALTSCKDEVSSSLDSIQVSTSYVALPTAGGSVNVTVKAAGEWKVDTAAVALPSWLELSALSGAAGESTLTFKAEAYEGREAEVRLVCNGETQRINVIQGIAEVAKATCAEVAAGPDSKTYRVTGTCTNIYNTTYGNWYLNDGTVNGLGLVIYGTLDAKGAEKNFTSLGIEVGDIVTVEGPKTTYNGTVELVNVSVIKIEKSLIKVDSISAEVLSKEGEDFDVFLVNKGTAVNVEVPADAEDWLSIKSVYNNVVTFHATANEGGARSTTLTFSTEANGKTYSCQASVSQEGSIVEVEVEAFMNAEVGDAQYRLTGVVSQLDAKGNPYLKDFSGEVLVYKMDAGDATFKVGDIITVVGKRAEYKGTPQVGSGVLESVSAVESISLADFNNLEDNKEKYYMIEGTVGKCTIDGTKFDLEKYGNFALFDEAGNEVYIYGCKRGYGDTQTLFSELGVKEGDKLVMIAYKTSYKGTNEGVGFCFSHTPANAARKH